MNRARWKTVEFSRNQIIKAGKTIKQKNATNYDKEQAIRIIDNWRAAHAFPLNTIYMHLRRYARDEKNIVVAERLKRLDSILNKLEREPTMSLWTMQDLGGCRVIVPRVSDVYRYADKYEKSRKRHILKNEYDYINNPKTSGYRSLHRVYEYRSDLNDKYNHNMLIELQFRTKLQHIWATAVETMGLFTKEAIKSGQGSDDVKRFFALVSSLFAIKEKQPIVPCTSDSITELIREIKQIDGRNNYLNMLNGIKVASYAQDHIKMAKDSAYYILEFDYNKYSLTIHPFRSSDIDKANETYNHIESKRSESKSDAVLVRVSSFTSLRAAYPNYFSDISEFVQTVNKYISR